VTIIVDDGSASRAPPVGCNPTATAKTALVSQRRHSTTGLVFKFGEGETTHAATRKATTMDQEERNGQFGTWLCRAWNAALRTAEAMERIPFDELFDRVDRLEREVAVLKQAGTTTIDGPDT